MNIFKIFCRKTIRRQQKEIDALRESIDLKDEYIRKIIQKYRVNQKDRPNEKTK